MTYLPHIHTVIDFMKHFNIDSWTAIVGGTLTDLYAIKKKSESKNNGGIK